jgi:FdhE protein
MAVSAEIDDLKRRRPEWTPWLTLVDEALRESANGTWDPVVPVRRDAPSPVPALSGVSVTLAPKPLGRLLERLTAIAARGGTAKMATLANLGPGNLDLAGLFCASMTHDVERVNAIAAERNVDAEALQAIATLLALPFLHACRRQWAASLPTWTGGWCPICGAWPVFAEVRGVERRRFNRCGRCGGEWHAQLLQCAYCSTTQHEQLVALIPEKAGATGAVDACRRCCGYLKVFTRLQGCAPTSVMTTDLASVDLDVAALDAGYKRPQGAGCAPGVSVQMAVGRSVLAWNA